eukprot:1481482-Pleurochrysis_carterae.AAC.1
MKHTPSKKIEDCSERFFCDQLNFLNVPADIPEYKRLLGVETYAQGNPPALAAEFVRVVPARSGHSPRQPPRSRGCPRRYSIVVGKKVRRAASSCRLPPPAGTLHSRVTRLRATARRASYAHKGSAPIESPLRRLRTSIGVARSRDCWSLMPTTDTSAHGNSLLAGERSIHWMDAHVMSREASKSRS